MSRQDATKKLIDINQRRLQKLREQEAIYGKSVDPSILLEIEDIVDRLKALQSELVNLESSDRSVSFPDSRPKETTKKESNPPSNPFSLRNILAGIMITIIGGVILAFIIQEGRFAPPTPTATHTITPTSTDTPTGTPAPTHIAIPIPMNTISPTPTDTTTATSIPDTPTPIPPSPTPAPPTPTKPALPQGKGMLVFENKFGGYDMIIDIIGPTSVSAEVPAQCQKEFVLDPGFYQYNLHSPGGDIRFIDSGREFEIFEGEVTPIILDWY
jgi:hypothetical protein